MARLHASLRRAERLEVRVAAIDVGTNSTRLLVAEGWGGDFRPLDRRMIVTRLGEGVDRNRALAHDALERTLLTVAEYAATCGEYGVERMRVTGTSAVRDARNRDEFFDGIEKLTGRAPEMLSGETEARTTFLGALSDLDGGLPALVVDIGGGSTELVYGTDEPERLVSLDIGCVRLFEKHLHSDPPSSRELDALRGEVWAALDEAKEQLDAPSEARLIGVAGTVTQLAQLKTGLPVYDPDVTHHMVLSHGDVRQLVRRLESLTLSQRRRVKGLEPGRADVILAGGEVLVAVMETFDSAEVLVSEKDILDGLVIELLR